MIERLLSNDYSLANIKIGAVFIFDLCQLRKLYFSGFFWFSFLEATADTVDLLIISAQRYFVSFFALWTYGPSNKTNKIFGHILYDINFINVWHNFKPVIE